MSTIPDSVTMANLLSHEGVCRRISEAKGCLYPPEAETLYWLIDALRQQLAASEQARAEVCELLKDIREHIEARRPNVGLVFLPRLRATAPASEQPERREGI